MRPVLVNLATAVIGRRKQVDLQAIAAAAPKASLKDAQTGERDVWFDGGVVTTPVYRREWLPVAAAFIGPAIVEQLDCTTVIEPGARVAIDQLANMIIEVTA